MSRSEHPIVARLYDPVMSLAERETLPPHRKFLADDLSGRVLDLGAGTGAMFPYFAGADADLHAVEPDPHMRAQASERAADLDLAIGLSDASAESLPYEDDSFDVVVASFAFCTIPDHEAALSEAARVLRPGGEFRFLEHVRGEGTAGRVHDLVAPGWHAVAGGCHLNRETGALFRADDRFRLLEYEQLSGGFMPIIRGRMERTRDGSGIRRALGRVPLL
jgi:SAM-dependent methyltransferase